VSRSNGNGSGRLGSEPQDPRFPYKGKGFPRRYMETTPQEILYDPTRIMGTQISAKLTPTGRTVLRQPRLETQAYTEEEKQCPPLEVPFPCPAPPSQVPYIKRQIHLDLSRDAEVLYCCKTVDVPAAVGAVPGVATIMRISTLNNMRTFIRWIDFQVFDAFNVNNDPGITLQPLVQGEPRSLTKCTTTNPDNGGTTSYTPTGGTTSTPTADNYQCLPPYFHNVLMETTDSRNIDFRVSNAIPAVRRTMLVVWGWIEAITVWDEAVRR
jgi:hypothetical protein